MKLKRDEFKAILKECILELVQEGKIFQQPTVAQYPAAQVPGQMPQTLNEDGGGYMTPNSRLEEAVKITANLVSKGNPQAASMYHSIFADTARTTLQKQLAAGMGGGGALYGGVTVLPEERQADQAQLGMFEGNSRWATLAFGKKTGPSR